MPLTDTIRPEPNPPLTVERVELARAMYVEGFTVARICSQCLMSLGTLYKCLDGIPFGKDGLRFPPIPRRRNILGKRTRALRADPDSLRNRLIRTAERQVRDIELRLSQTGRSGPDCERDMRMPGMAVKSLRDLQRLTGEETTPEDPLAAHKKMTDNVIRNWDALREDLMHRLNALILEQEGQEGTDASS